MLARPRGGDRSYCYAVETKAGLRTSNPTIEKGKLKNLSLRSDGRLALAPRFEEILFHLSPYLWALAEDSKGNCIPAAAARPRSEAFRVIPAGKSKTLAELPGLEIHAIAVDRKDRVYAATSPDGKVYRVATRRQARGVLRPEGEIHLGPGVRQQG